MVYNPSANWTTAIADDQQAPVYYLAIDGLTSEHYSTHPVKSAGTTKKPYMNVPSGGGATLDPIDGTYSVGDVRCEILDIDGDMTDLISADAAGAPLSALINRKATLYGGYRDLAETDYAAVYTGRITGLAMNKALTGYVFSLSDPGYQLDGEIMSDATETTPATVRGPAVNVYWAIMTGTFSTTHGTFPLDYVSTATTVSSAPTGLGIATADINETQLVEQRDTWHVTDVANVEFIEPENARTHLQAELFRIFQSWPVASGGGLLGLRFHVPALPASSAPQLTTDDIVAVTKWQRMYGDHLNKFIVKGDYNTSTSEYDTTLYNTETTEDTTNQSTTEETITYLAESRWLDSSYDGVGIATELAGRMRIRYLYTPAMIDLEVTMKRRNLEQGDVIAVTHPELPDLLTGTRGLTDKLMTIISIAPNFDRGTMKFTLLDTGYNRYGVIGESAQTDYGSATNIQKNTFAWVGATSTNLVGGTDPGYGAI